MPGMQHFREFTEIFRHQAGPPSIAAAALGDYKRRIAADQAFDSFRIDFSVLQLSAVKSDAHVLQAARNMLFPDADNAQQGIVRHSCGADDVFARSCQPEKRQAQCRGSAGDMRPHQAGFCMKNPCVNPFQRITPDIVVSVSGGSCEMAVADLFLPECLQDQPCPFLFVPVNFCKKVLQFFFRCKDNSFNSGIAHFYHFSGSVKIFSICLYAS